MKVKIIFGTVLHGAKYNEKAKKLEGEKSATVGDAIELEDDEAKRLIERGVAAAVEVPKAEAPAAPPKPATPPQDAGGSSNGTLV